MLGRSIVSSVIGVSVAVIAAVSYVVIRRKQKKGADEGPVQPVEESIEEDI